MIELKTYLQLNHRFTCSHTKLLQIVECLNELYDKSFIDKHDNKLHLLRVDLDAIEEKYGSTITYRARTIAMYKGA